LWVGGLLLIVAAVYVPSLGHPFHWDDRIFLADDNVVSGRWERLLDPPGPRWLTWVAFTIQSRLSGPDPAVFHTFSVLLHALNAILVLLLLRHSTGIGASPAPPSGRWRLTAPGLGAALFALHPVQTESVLYIYQQSTLLAAFFCLLSLNCWIRGRHLPALLLVLPAVAARETALVLPLAFWLADGCLRGRWRPTGWTLAALAASVAGGAAAMVSGWPQGDPTLGGSRLAYLAAQVPVFALYLQRVLFPVNLNLDPDIPLPADLGRISWWLALVPLAAAGAALVWACRRHPAVGFWGLLFPLFLFPASSLVPSQDPMSEHRLYLPMVGIAGVAATMLARRRPSEGSPAEGRLGRWRPHPAVIASWAVLGVWVLLDRDRVRIWGDETSLWQDTVHKSPRKFRPRYNLGVLLMDRDLPQAYAVLSEAVRIDPTQPMAYRSLGEVFWRQGRHEAAERAWQQALTLVPTHAPTHRALGLLYTRRGEFARALHHLERALVLDPLAWRSHFDLAAFYFRFGFVDEAVAACEAGLRLHPERRELRLLLADLMMETRNWSRAVELYGEPPRQNSERR
jgi:tetratricopeptide (TPR) repeat protein